MSSNNDSFITTPVGRLVWGSIMNPKTKDSTGKPLVVKTGPDAGKPAPRYEFGVAIPKGSETHWAQTPWGQLIYAAGVAGFPNRQYERPDFSWKVTDGDSKIPNKRGVAPCTRQGHAGHWILAFSSSFAPETLDAKGANRIEASQIKLGYYIQVAGSLKANNNLESPGVYLNSRFVSLQAGHSGLEIATGPDPSSLGFGLAALPPGVATTPTTGSFTPPVMTPAVAPASPAPAVAPPPAVVAPPPVVVTPHAAILTPPAPPVGPRMTPKAGGATREQFLAAGWTDDALVAEGYMVRS